MLTSLKCLFVFPTVQHQYIFNLNLTIWKGGINDYWAFTLDKFYKWWPGLFSSIRSAVVTFIGSVTCCGCKRYAGLSHLVTVRGKRPCMIQWDLLMTWKVVMTQIAWSQISSERTKLRLLCSFEPEGRLIRGLTILSRGLTKLNDGQVAPVMFWRRHNVSQMPGSLQQSY